jgi:hypothetical protein
MVWATPTQNRLVEKNWKLEGQGALWSRAHLCLMADWTYCVTVPRHVQAIEKPRRHSPGAPPPNAFRHPTPCSLTCNGISIPLDSLATGVKLQMLSDNVALRLFSNRIVQDAFCPQNACASTEAGYAPDSGNPAPNAVLLQIGGK